MESILVSALAEGIKTGRLPLWTILAIGGVVALFRVVRPIGSAALSVVAHVARIEKIGEDLATNLKELAGANASEHKQTRVELGKEIGRVGAQLTAIEASLRGAVSAEGTAVRSAVGDLERTVLDNRASVAAAKVGELAAVIEERSVDEIPPVEVPAPHRRSRHAPSRG
jgi:hypothetical protein